MNLIEQLKTWLRERGMRGLLNTPYRSARKTFDASVATSTSLADFGEQLGEQLRLAKTIADTAAQSDIECNCNFEQFGRFTWYDIHEVDPLFDRSAIDNSVRYLELRHRLVRHPQQKHLVRFPQ